MKNYAQIKTKRYLLFFRLLLALLFLAQACKKDQKELAITTESTNVITTQEARNWLQENKVKLNTEPQWRQAKITSGDRDFSLLKVPIGQYSSKTGKEFIFNDLVFAKDSAGHMQSIIYRTIVDTAYFFKKGQIGPRFKDKYSLIDNADFTGSVFVIGLDRLFLKGRKYQGGILKSEWMPKVSTSNLPKPLLMSKRGSIDNSEAIDEDPTQPGGDLNEVVITGTPPAPWVFPNIVPIPGVNPSDFFPGGGGGGSTPPVYPITLLFPKENELKGFVNFDMDDSEKKIKIDPKYITKYPKLVEIVKKLYAKVSTNAKIMAALVKYTGLTEKAILNTLKVGGSGPTLIVRTNEQMKSVRDGKNIYPYGMTIGDDANKPFIFINEDYVSALEKGTGANSDALALLLSTTILHEYVHWADNVFALNPQMSYGMEMGELFEKDAFGGIIEYDKNNGRILYRKK